MLQRGRGAVVVLQKEKQAGYYPPAKTGMRGSHDGSWEAGHALRDGKEGKVGPSRKKTKRRST